MWGFWVPNHNLGDYQDNLPSLADLTYNFCSTSPRSLPKVLFSYSGSSFKTNMCFWVKTGSKLGSLLWFLLLLSNGPIILHCHVSSPNRLFSFKYSSNYFGSQREALSKLPHPPISKHDIIFKIWWPLKDKWSKLDIKEKNIVWFQLFEVPRITNFAKTT